MEKRIPLGFGLALAVLAATGAVSVFNTRELIATSRWVSHTHEEMAQLEGTLSTITEAETGAQGYALTGDERYLEPTDHALQHIDERLKRLEQLIGEDTVRQKRLAVLRHDINEKIKAVNELVEARKRGGYAAAQRVEAGGRGKAAMDEVRNLIAEMILEEKGQLLHRAVESEASAKNATLNVTLMGILSIALLLAAYVAMRQDIRARMKAERETQEAHHKLTVWVSELEQRTREITLLHQMADQLQSCITMPEASSVIAEFVQRIFPEESGGIYVLAASGNLVEETAAWGESQVGERVFAPAECWALRGGRLHIVDDSHAALRCGHVSPVTNCGYVCVPMMAQGEALGILHLQSPMNEGDLQRPGCVGLTEGKQRLAVTVSENVALALANLRLREKLRMQSIRDPLTGLFNRRYLEESLERELRRAARNQRTVGVIMFDIDHFKQFNDTFGHDAGDAILRELGAFLKKRSRGEDIACRYGGEEFTLVLPDTSLESTRQRAHYLRDEVKHLDVQHRGQSLGAISVSIGLAVFPTHGANIENILRAADEALYAAKAAGRDQVIVGQVVV